MNHGHLGRSIRLGRSVGIGGGEIRFKDRVVVGNDVGVPLEDHAGGQRVRKQSTSVLTARYRDNTGGGNGQERGPTQLHGSS